jgi:hypothetical protein
MTASAANEYLTRTLTVQVDFFGVMGSRLSREITDTRNVARRAFKDLTNLARLSGIISEKESVILISQGTDHVGKRFFIFTLKDERGNCAGTLSYSAPATTTDTPLEVGDGNI